MTDDPKTIQYASEKAITPGHDTDGDKVDAVEQHGEDGHYVRSFTARQIHVSLEGSVALLPLIQRTDHVSGWTDRGRHLHLQRQEPQRRRPGITPPRLCNSLHLRLVHAAKRLGDDHRLPRQWKLHRLRRPLRRPSSGLCRRLLHVAGLDRHRCRRSDILQCLGQLLGRR